MNKLLAEDLKLKTVQVTHEDHDGYGCSIPTRLVFEDIRCRYVGYADAPDIIYEQLDRDDVKLLIISDLSFKQPKDERLAETIDQMNKSGKMKVLLFDHHPDSLWLNQYDWAQVDDSECGSTLVYKFLDGSLTIDGYLGERWRSLKYLVGLIRDYDLWIFDHSVTRDLQSLFVILGGEKFVLRCLTRTNPVILTPEERMLIALEKERDDKYIRETEVFMHSEWITEDQITLSYVMVFAERLESRIGHRFVEEEGFDFCVILNPRLNKASLRSKKGVDVNAIATQFNGGGHKQASGFPFDPRIMLTSLNDIHRKMVW